MTSALRKIVHMVALSGWLVAIGAVAVAPADAYLLDLAWRPVESATGYRLYVRFDGESRDLSLDVGAVTVNEAGEAVYQLRSLPVGPTTYFSVASYDADGNDGPRSNELSIDYATAAAFSDSDRDGLTDAHEDADLDGVVDAGESDPRDADSDDDGLLDGEEVDEFGSSPIDADSDGDGFDDGAEVGGGTDPADPDSFLDRCGDGDGNGRINLSDVLFVLSAATHVRADCPILRCDTTGNGIITATDVLAVLAALVDTNVPMRCSAT